MSRNKHVEPVTFDPAQIRAARALLGWSRDELASKSGLCSRTIMAVENGESTPVTLNRIAGYLMTQGVFLRVDDEGRTLTVQLRRPPSQPATTGSWPEGVPRF